MEEQYSWEQVIAEKFFSHDWTIISDKRLAQNEVFLGETEQVLEKMSLCKDDLGTLPVQIMRSKRDPVIIAGNLNKIITLLNTVSAKNMKLWPNIRLYKQDSQSRAQLNSFYKTTIAILKRTTSAKQSETDLARREAKTRKDNKEESQEILEKFNQTLEQWEAAKKNVDSLLPNVLTILGIFVAIIIAVVAAYLSVILLQEKVGAGITVFHTVVTCVLLGHVLLNLIFLFIYLISRMTTFTLACYCVRGKHSDCTKCDKNERCSWWNRLWFRYPYVVLFNAICIIAYFALGIWRIVSEYIGSEIDMAFKTQVGSTVGLTIGLITLALLLLWVAYRLFTYPKKDIDAKKTETECRKAEAARKEAQQARSEAQQAQNAAKRAQNEAKRARNEAIQARKQVELLLGKARKTVEKKEKELAEKK